MESNRPVSIPKRIKLIAEHDDGISNPYQLFLEEDSSPMYAEYLRDKSGLEYDGVGLDEQFSTRHYYVVKYTPFVSSEHFSSAAPVAAISVGFQTYPVAGYEQYNAGRLFGAVIEDEYTSIGLCGMSYTMLVINFLLITMLTFCGLRFLSL